jgi:hypothetical protein
MNLRMYGKGTGRGRNSFLSKARENIVSKVMMVKKDSILGVVIEIDLSSRARS